MDESQESENKVSFSDKLRNSANELRKTGGREVNIDSGNINNAATIAVYAGMGALLLDAVLEPGSPSSISPRQLLDLAAAVPVAITGTLLDDRNPNKKPLLFSTSVFPAMASALDKFADRLEHKKS